MDGVFALGGMVNNDVKIVAAFTLYHDKLLILGRFAGNVVHKVHVALRGKGLRLGFRDNAAVVGGNVIPLCVGGHGKAAHADKGGKEYKKAAEQSFILHGRCPPVRKFQRVQRSCREYRRRKA